MRAHVQLAGMVALAAGATASAQDYGVPGTGLAGGRQAGLASYQISDRLGLRVPTGDPARLTGVGIDALAASIDGIGLMADFFPAGGGVRVSGGAYVGHDWDGQWSAGGDGDRPPGPGIDPARWGAVTPTVALGYRGEIGRGWALSADLGAIYVANFALDPVAGPSSGAADRSTAPRRMIQGPDMVPYVKLSVALRF